MSNSYVFENNQFSVPSTRQILDMRPFYPSRVSAEGEV